MRYVGWESPVKKTTHYKEKKKHERWRRRYLKHWYRWKQRRRDIVYVDETGFAPTTHRSHGWSERGKRTYGEIHSDKRPRTSLIGGFLNRLLIAPLVFEGTCNTEVFNQWLKECLLPELQPQSVIVMDNAAFHKSQETRTLIKKAGCLLLFLPPYSPHLNPIEKLWANIKRAWSYNSLKSLDSIIAQYC